MNVIAYFVKAFPVELPATLFAIANCVTVIGFDAELSLEQVPWVHLAVKITSAVGVSVMVNPIFPFDHVTVPVAQAEEVSTTDSPTQILVLFKEIVGVVGFGLTVIEYVFDFVLRQVPLLHCAE